MIVERERGVARELWDIIWWDIQSSSRYFLGGWRLRWGRSWLSNAEEDSGVVMEVSCAAVGGGEVLGDGDSVVAFA